jgi:ABC-type glycerol-3-phosphate transport system permease component
MSIGPYAAAGSAKASTRLQLAVVLFVILAPVAWMVLSSFKESADVTAYPRAWSSRRRSRIIETF